MSKILNSADAHIAAHKQSNKRLQDCLNAFYWVFQTARDRNIKDVVFAGDLLHDRSKINVFAYHQTYQIIKQFSDLNIWLLLGNHDLWYYEKTDISSVIPFGALSHVTVIDKPSTYNIAGLNIDFLPFTYDPLTVMSEHFKERSQVLVGHIALHGAILNSHHMTKAEVLVEFDNDMTVVTKELFDGYKRVFLGHYHEEQKLSDTVEYIGSTLQLTFGEAFQKKHIVVLDTETLEKEYIENTFSPKHFLLEPHQLEEYKDQLDGNFVRIYMDTIGETDMADIRSQILEKSPEAQITFTHHKKKKQEDEQIKKFNLTEGDTIELFVKNIDCGNLDQELLIKIGKEICLINSEGL